MSKDSQALIPAEPAQESFAWRAAKTTTNTTWQVLSTTGSYAAKGATWLMATTAWVAGGFVVGKAVDTAIDAVVPYQRDNGTSASKIVGSIAIAGTGIWALGPATAFMHPLAFAIFMAPAARHIAYPIAREVAVQTTWGSLGFLGGLAFYRWRHTQCHATPQTPASAQPVGLLTAPPKVVEIEESDAPKTPRPSVADID